MKTYGYLFTLVLCTLFIIPKGQAEEKWSWGKTDNKISTENNHNDSSDEEIVPRSVGSDFSSTTTVESSENFGKNPSGENAIGPPGVSQGRTLRKFFKDLGCRFRRCKEKSAPFVAPLYASPVPVPVGGPIPIPVGSPVPVPVGSPIPVPVYSSPIAVATGPQRPYPPGPQRPYPPGPQIPYPPGPQRPYPPPVIAPIHVPKPVPTKVGYPPTPIITEHHHTHTHIHKGAPIAPIGSIKPIASLPPIEESPYKYTGYPPRPGFSPTVLNGGSHVDSKEIFDRPIGNLNGYNPIAVQPEAVTGTLYRPAKSLYVEECQCVLPQYCSPYDVVRKTSVGKDIAHLINPRNEALSILSNDTDSHEEIRGKRDAPLITNRQPVAATRSSTAKGRAIGGYTPGFTGCGHNYVCCRSSIQEPKKFDGICGKSLKNAIHGRVANTAYNRGATQFGEFPWQGAILKEKNYESLFVCGATLVSQQHVLTAAHCVVDEPAESLVVRLGDWDVNGENEFYKHIELPVYSLVVHPKFYAGNLENDIAVITFQGYIDFLANPHISPVCLPNAYTDFTHQHCYVSGWGKDAFGYSGEFQQILKKVDVPIVDRQSCQYALQEARLGPDYYLPEGFICAGGEEGKDTCKGDGGGPLVCPTRYNTYELAGIVSWGIGCGLKGVPGVYVNIPYYAEWIRSIVDYS